MRNALLLTALFVSGVFSPFANSAPKCTRGVSLTANVAVASPPPNAETPAAIACVYGLTPQVPGCRIADARILPSGGWGVIAVTEGGHDPFALQELNTFSAQFNLPLMTECASIDQPSAQPCFAVVYATEDGKAPPLATGKDLREHALDVEMAHAMAPNASIIMVEAKSFSQFGSESIFDAVHCANTVVDRMGGGIISNSWSIPEYAGETEHDSKFQTPGIVYIGSSGDELAPAHYPAVSPNIVSVGATQIVRDSSGNFLKEVSWNSPDIGDGTSGGPSVFVPRPAFQNSVMKIVGNARGTPDIAAVGYNIAFYYIDNCTESLAFDCQANWAASAGTSFAAPIMAGIINAANSRASSSQEELAIIYNGARKNYHNYWHDVIEGTNGFPTLQGYDFVTGLGTPQGYLGK